MYKWINLIYVAPFMDKMQLKTLRTIQPKREKI